jgi:UDP-glucuronate decarboxylase
MDFKNFKVIRQDVITPINIEADFIFNLACPASPIHYSTDPVQTVRTNVIGALNVLELAHRLKIPVFQASTSEVYGDPEISPQKESYVGSVNPIGPRACYDEGKRCAETLFFDYRRQYDLDVRVGRIFNTYGPRMHPQDGRVVSNFIVQALNGDDITIYGDGSQTRSFCYIDDMVQAMIEMMKLQQPPEMPVNLGSPSEITIGSLADSIVEIIGSDCNIRYLPLPVDDPKQRQPDIGLAKQILKWEASTSLATGLAYTIAYFRNLFEK